MVGTILGNRYKLISELGSGGMAWVYLAEDLRDQQKVAVKILYPQHSQDLGFLQRFVREAKLAMSLSQSSPEPHVVRVLDYGADRDTHYLVMEFAPGRDLGQLLDEQGPLPWPEALDLARQVALALGHAHRYEIVHRDIKPSNIMVLPGGTARVLDFGIARARTSPELTLSGFVGSPHYAAPEQATGKGVDIRADIYSLGIVLFKMLCGSLPFEGDTPWAVVNQHISSPPPSLARIHPDLPESVVRLVQRAMSKRPEDRFQTPAEMVRAIEAVLAGLELPPETLASDPEEGVLPLGELYRRGQHAVEAERWQEAVDLFSRILKADPDYRDVIDRLSEVGLQIRLAALYRSATRALQVGQWDQALAHLDKIAGIAPRYRDIEELRTKAEGRQKLKADGRSATPEFPTQVDTEDAGEDRALVAAGAGLEGTREATVLVSASTRIWIGFVVLLVLAVVVFLAYRAWQPATAPVAGVQPSYTATLPPANSSTVTLPPSSRPVTVTPGSAIPDATSTPRDTSTPRATPTPAGLDTSPTSAVTYTPAPTSILLATLTPAISMTRTAEPLLTGQIAFPRFDAVRGTYDVHVCRVDGSGCRVVVAEASQPDFLPDGDQIVIHSWKPDEKGLVLHVLSEQRIWRITDQIEAARPSVDFEGSTYVYHSRQEADRQPRLYRTYGTETRPIVHEANAVLGWSPTWLPDGRILYSGCWQDSCGILVLRADGSHPGQVVAGITETDAEASPDGQQVAFMSQRDGNWEVYVVNIDGSGLRRLTRHAADDGLPSWSPDGRHIAFVSDRDDQWAVWVMRPDGSERRRLFTLGGSLDGRVRDAAPHETHGWVEERISWGPLP